MDVTLSTRARRQPIRARASEAFWARARGRLIRQGELPPVPAFRLTDTHGAEISNETISGRPSLLVFSSPHCAPCSELYPTVAAIARRRADLNVVLVSRGARATNIALRARFELECPVVGGRNEVEQAFGVTVVPFAVLVASDGRVLAGGPTMPSHLAALAERASHPMAGGTANREGQYR